MTSGQIGQITNTNSIYRDLKCRRDWICRPWPAEMVPLPPPAWVIGLQSGPLESVPDRIQGRAHAGCTGGRSGVSKGGCAGMRRRDQARCTHAAVGDMQAKQGPCIVSRTADHGRATDRDARTFGGFVLCFRETEEMEWMREVNGMGSKRKRKDGE
jgi:hypothetical protein